MALGQTTLAGQTVRFDRRSVVVAGLTVYAVTFAAYIPFHSATGITLIAASAGLAYGIVGPVMTTAYLDRTAPAAQASVLGIRTATMAAGGIIGPLALAVVHPWASPSVVFSATAFGLGVAALTASVAFRTTPTPRSSLDRTARTVRSDLSV